MGHRTTQLKDKVKIHKTNHEFISSKTEDKISFQHTKNNVLDKTTFFYHTFRNALLVFLPLLVISALVLFGLSLHASATISNSEADTITLNLSTSCTISSTLINEHTINLNGGQYGTNIGNTKVNAYCNDNNGYSIYAIGYSGNVDGDTDLVGNISNDYNIHTGTYSSSSTASSWGMKLTPGNGTGIDPTTGETVSITPPTIVNDYNNYNVVPSIYTLVAKRESGTSMTTDTTASGSYFNTTYDIYASSVQPAGTYVGKVKYLMTHPNTNAPNTINDIDAAFAVAGKQKVYQDENGSYYAMQDMSSDICNLVTRTGESTSAQLVDIRDNNIYWATKEKDGHCWMTQNLDLDINGPNTSPLNSNNTDISTDPNISGTGIYAKGYTENNGVWAWSPTTTSNATINYEDNTVTNWVYSGTTPSSAEGGDTYFYTSDTNSNDTKYTSLQACEQDAHTITDCKHYHVGNYYNYTATVASNNSTGFNTQYNNAENSICPKGWRLPVAINDAGTTIEFGKLLSDYKIILTPTSSGYAYTSDGFMNIRKSPLWFVRSGFINNGSLSSPTSGGYYWSSTVFNVNSSYYLNFNSNVVNSSNNGDYKHFGRTIRCLAR